jgi:hypothetical protein
MSRSAVLALAALVVLVFALAITLLPRGAPSPTTSPSPTVAAATSPVATTSGTAVASPTAEPTATTTGRLGIVTSRVRSDGTAGEYVVRSEDEPRAIAVLAMGFANSACPCRPDFAVSPDGRRFAFWTPGQTGANSLEIWDASRPDRTTKVLASPSGEVGTRVAWSSDGAGLLLAFDSVEMTAPPGAHVGGWPVASALRTLVLSDGAASPATIEVARVSAPAILAPMAWDRSARTIAALESEGMSRPLRFLLIRDGVPSRTPLENPLTGVYGSPNGWVAMDFARPPHRIVAWRDDPARATELLPADGQFLSLHGWVPGSSRVMVSTSGAPGPLSPSSLFIWDVVTGQRIAIPGVSERTGSIVARVDGAAIYVNASQSVATIVDVASGAQRTLPSLGGREHVYASVLIR